MDDIQTQASDFNLGGAVTATVIEPPPTPAPVPAAEASAPSTPSSDPLDSFLGQAGGTGGGATGDKTPVADANAATTKLRVIAKALRAIESNLTNIIRLIEEDASAAGPDPAAAAVMLKDLAETDLAAIRPTDGRVVEGVFDGQQMVGSDGKIYTVPANYASKSKLVEGDLLKLTITPKGSFIYKQIGPIERSRLIGALGFDPTNGEYYVTTDNRRWGVLKASVTYFKGEPGDEAVILVPKNAPSKWAAVENIIKKGYLG